MNRRSFLQSTGLALGVAVVAAITLVPAAPAKASGKLGEIVRAFCLSAFQNELSQAGKTAPAGMASYACDCVADRISTGSSIEAARSDCRTRCSQSGAQTGS